MKKYSITYYKLPLGVQRLQFKIFINFLNKNNCLEKYFQNFYKDMYTFFMGRDAETYIISSFSWSKTEEDVIFWSDLNASWRRFFDKMRKIYNI